MARRTQSVPITDEGRDKGKVFLIREMAAEHAEAWAIRALLALTNSGANIPNLDPSQGMAGVARAAAVGALEALQKLKYEDVKPLLDDMWTCVEYRINPADPTSLPVNDYIEEVATRMQLRKAVFVLHTGFSQGGATPTVG